MSGVEAYPSGNLSDARLRGGFPMWRESGCLHRQCPEHDWDAITAPVGEFLNGLVCKVASEEVLIPRLEHFSRLRLLEVSGEAAPAQFSAALGKLAALRRMLLDRERQVGDLRQSLSWKITAPLCAVYELLLCFKPSRL